MVNTHHINSDIMYAILTTFPSLTKPFLVYLYLELLLCLVASLVLKKYNSVLINVKRYKTILLRRQKIINVLVMNECQKSFLIFKKILLNWSSSDEEKI